MEICLFFSYNSTFSNYELGLIVDDTEVKSNVPTTFPTTATPLYCGKINVGFFNSKAITGAYLDIP